MKLPEQISFDAMPNILRRPLATLAVAATLTGGAALETPAIVEAHAAIPNPAQTDNPRSRGSTGAESADQSQASPATPKPEGDSYDKYGPWLAGAFAVAILLGAGSLIARNKEEEARRRNYN